MQEKQFTIVPGFYPLTVSEDGEFRNAESGKTYTPSMVVHKSGRVSWMLTISRDKKGVKANTSITVQRAWALCYLPKEGAVTMKVVLRDNPVRLEDAVDPANVVWVRSYCGREINTVLDDGTEVMAVTIAARQVNAPVSTIREHLLLKGYSDAGTQPVYLM